MNAAGALGDELHLVKDGVSFFEETRLLDTGKLIIRESSVDWEGENRNFSLLYRNICLHAISRDPYGGDENAKFPHPHVFLMVDGERVWSSGETPVSGHGDNGMDLGAEDNDEEETSSRPDEDNNTFNLRFVPINQRDLDELYDAIAECQALNPDPEDLSDDEFASIEEDGENGDDDNYNEDVDPANFSDN